MAVTNFIKKIETVILISLLCGCSAKTTTKTTTITRFDSDGTTVTKNIEVYDDNDRLLSKTFVNADGEKSETKYTYEKDGSFTSVWTSNGKQHTSKYDSHGNSIESEGLNAENQMVTYKNEYAYDDQGRMIEQKFLTGTLGTCKYTYDDTEHVEKEWCEFENGITRGFDKFYFYREDGTLAQTYKREFTNPVGDNAWGYQYIDTYNEKELLTTSEVTSLTGEKAHTLFYEYDEDGREIGYTGIDGNGKTYLEVTVEWK